MSYQNFVESLTSPICEMSRVDERHFNAALSNLSYHATVLDLYKKSIFYGKPLHELGLPTGSGMRTKNEHLFHAILGIITEAGELSENLIDQSNKQNVIEELGDLLFYIAMAANALDTTVFEIMIANQRKLRARYPDRFTAEQALNRDTAAEMAAFNGGT